MKWNPSRWCRYALTASLSLSLVAMTPATLAAQIFFDPANFRVSVAGTPDPDVIVISNESATEVRVTIDTLGAVESQVIALADLALIVAGGEGGDDQIINTTSVPMNASGHDGNDTLSGGSGNDLLTGGPGDDQLIGNDGDDVLVGEDGNDNLVGGPGNDKLYSGPGDDSLGGDEGDDVLVGDIGDDVLSGGDDNDQLFGNEGEDFLRGGAGSDLADGGPDNDTVEGGDGTDTLLGGSGDDEVSGNDGNDIIQGDEGNDALNGGVDDDIIAGGPGNDIIAGFDGDDHISGNEGNDGLDGGFGNDQMFGGPGDDDLVGGDGNDLMNGGPDNDFFLSGGGADSVYGEDGDDRLDGDVVDAVLDGGAGTNEINTEHVPVRFGIVANPANDPISSDEDIFRAMEKSKTVADQVSLFLSFRAQDKLSDLLDLIPVINELEMSQIIQIGVQFLGEPNPPAGMNKTFADPDVRQLFLDNVAALAATQPKTLVLSPEVNIMYWINRAEFDLFATLYQEAYDLAKSISPNTDVGVSYHYTLFRGCEQFDMIDEMGPQDFLGFTTYPIWLLDKEIIPDVDGLPPEWWSWMRWAYPNKKIIITEIGFPNTRNATEAQQANFVARLPELFEYVQPESVNWTLLSNVVFFDVDKLSQSTLDFLLDIGVNPDLLMGRLNNMGLHSHPGTPKLSWFEALKLRYDWEDHPVGPDVPLGVARQDPEDLPAICSRFDPTELP